MIPLAVTILSSLILMIIIAYVLGRKHLHTFEQFLVLFLLIIGYTCFVSIVDVNLELWNTSQKTNHMVAFRLYSILFLPFTVLGFLELWLGAKNTFQQAIYFISCVFVLWGGDWVLRLNNVYQFKSWNNTWSIIMWVLIIVSTLIVQKLFRRLIKKEGIMS